MTPTINTLDISPNFDYENLSNYLQEITSCDWLLKYSDNKTDTQLFAVHDAHYWEEHAGHIRDKYIPRIAIGARLQVVNGVLSTVRSQSSIQPCTIIRSIYHNPSVYNGAKAKTAGIMSYINQRKRGNHRVLFESYTKGLRRIEPEYLVEHLKALLDCSTYEEISKRYGISTSAMHLWKKGKGTSTTLLLLRLLSACHNELSVYQEVNIMEAIQKFRVDK